MEGGKRSVRPCTIPKLVFEPANQIVKLNVLTCDCGGGEILPYPGGSGTCACVNKDAAFDFPIQDTM